MSAPRTHHGPAMAHAEAWDALPAAALGALDAGERERVLAHAAACPACVAELAALREAQALVAHAAPRAADAARRAAVRERLMARAAAETRANPPSSAPRALAIVDPSYERALADRASRSPDAARDVTPTGTPAPAAPAAPAVRDIASRRRWSPAPMLAAASLLAAAVLGTWAVRASHERDALRAGAATEVASARRDANDLRAALAERERTLGSLTGREVRVVELTTSGSRAPWARMFWDRATNRWTMFAGNLPAPASGRTYELWLIAGGKKIPAGTFTPDARGQAVVRAEYALAADQLQALAVTAEPTGGVDAPTGPVVIAGSAGTASR